MPPGSSAARRHIRVSLVATAAWIAGLPIDAGAAPNAANHAAAREAVIPKFVGRVTPDNATRFLEGVVGRTDKIVGLQVHIQPGGDKTFAEDRYLAEANDVLFSMSKSDSLDGEGLEMVAPAAEAVWLHGDYALDGFYLVKSGGVHQGITSIGLERVDEAAVLLSTKFRVVVRVVR